MGQTYETGGICSAGVALAAAVGLAVCRCATGATASAITVMRTAEFMAVTMLYPQALGANAIQGRVSAVEPMGGTRGPHNVTTRGRCGNGNVRRNVLECEVKNESLGSMFYTKQIGGK